MVPYGLADVLVPCVGELHALLLPVESCPGRATEVSTAVCCSRSACLLLVLLAAGARLFVAPCLAPGALLLVTRRYSRAEAADAASKDTETRHSTENSRPVHVHLWRRL